MKLAYIPNAITLSRLFLVPVLILALKDHRYLSGLIIFIIAGITDALDGYIAKRFNSVSQFGAVLDPLADKVLLVSAYVMLTVIGHVPFWLLLAVGFRDLLIIGGYLVVTSMMGAVQMHPSYLSKLNTFVQILLVIVILTQEAAALSFPRITQALIFLVLFTTVASGGHYIWQWVIKRELEPVAGPKKS